MTRLPRGTKFDTVSRIEHHSWMQACTVTTDREKRHRILCLLLTDTKTTGRLCNARNTVRRCAAKVDRSRLR